METTSLLNFWTLPPMHLYPQPFKVPLFNDLLVFGEANYALDVRFDHLFHHKHWVYIIQN